METGQGGSPEGQWEGKVLGREEKKGRNVLRKDNKRGRGPKRLFGGRRKK